MGISFKIWVFLVYVGCVPLPRNRGKSRFSPNYTRGYIIPLILNLLKMLGKGKRTILPNGGLMVMNPMVQSANNHQQNRSKSLVSFK